MTATRAFLALALVFLCALGIGTWRMGWSALWASPDQWGRYRFEHGRYPEAAQAFADPLWRGVAQFRAGDFKAAEASFAAKDTPEAAYDQGNALVMLGKYEQAVARYDRALAARPDWADARTNRTIAAIRAERMKAPGGNLGDQREGADEIVYDKNAENKDGQQTETTGTAAMNDEAVRALWLKRVQTRPADFLRSRFAYQLEAQQQQQGTGGTP